MRRFPLILSDSDYNSFYKLYPDWGQRTAILRKCVQRLVRNARLKGKLVDEVDEVVESFGEEE